MPEIYYSVHDGEHTTVADELGRDALRRVLVMLEDSGTLHRHDVGEWSPSSPHHTLYGTVSGDEALHRMRNDRSPVPS